MTPHILCKNRAAFEALTAVFPTVDGVELGGDRTPYANGGYVVAHPFGDDAIAALRAGLAAQIAAGDIWFAEELPPDWVWPEDGQ